MKRIWWLPFILILVFSLAACQGKEETSPPDSAFSSSINLLVVVEGSVNLKRESWSDFYPTSTGAVLVPGDQIQLSDGAQAMVICNDLSPWEVPEINVAQGLTTGCPSDEKAVLVRNGYPVSSPRGELSDVPLIIAPRATALLDSSPRLRFQELAGVTQYTLTISQTGWQKESKESDMIYDGEPFEPGVDYLLTVEADDGRSSLDDPTPNLGFRVFSEDQAQRVHESAAEIEKWQLPSAAQSLILAHFYAAQCEEGGRCLISAAIDELEASHDDQSLAAIYRLQGDLYRQIQLNELAEQAYLRAVELAKADGDIEAEALALMALATIHQNSSNETQKQEVIGWLEQARDHYQTVGDTSRVDELNQWLAKLGQGE